MVIPRIRFQSGGDPGCDTLPHLRSRRIGESHDQQAVNVRRMLPLTDHTDDTLYQYRRLTASRGRRYQNVAVMQFDYLLLFRGKIHSHTLPLFLFLFSCCRPVPPGSGCFLFELPVRHTLPPGTLCPKLPRSPASAASAPAYPDLPAVSSHSPEYCHRNRRPFYRRNKYKPLHCLSHKD